MKPRLRAPGVPLFVRIAAGYGLILLVMLAIAALTVARLTSSAAVRSVSRAKGNVALLDLPRY